jgi:hypothetical protein
MIHGFSGRNKIHELVLDRINGITDSLAFPTDSLIDASEFHL